MIKKIYNYLFNNKLNHNIYVIIGGGGFGGKSGIIPYIVDLDKALKVDSSSSVFGSFLGCAPVTSYVESSAGIEAGGRTGLTAVVVGVFFLIAVFFFVIGMGRLKPVPFLNFSALFILTSVVLIMVSLGS